ncbi:hypothetical protein AWB70_07562 [Caballeronia cordobensis]|uniref:Uncharacterized protein n=1 Tax=Caballeronia cordobensis TaxID=1353886 RepID=A0A158JW23_CABCO|nr:hypothetical protein AWB70_07562 [Caballeronia cordobensis]
MTGDLRFDLTQLDTEPTNLDLMIVTAKKLDVAIGSIACDIPRAIHTRAGNERIIDKSFGGKLRPIQITPRHTRPTDIKFTNRTRRHQPKLPVEQIDACIGNRLANDWPRLFDRDLGDSGIHRAFGRTIDVESANLRGCCEAIPHLLRQRLAADEQRQLGLATFKQTGGEQYVELRRRAVEYIDVAGIHIVDQRQAIGTHVGRNEGQPVSREQSREALQRRVERDAGVQTDARVRVAMREHRRLERVMQVHHITMLDHHAFGLAGRTGGVDHVGEVMRCDGGLRVMVRERIIERGIEHRQRSCVAESVTASGVSDQKHRRGIREDVAQAFARIRRIERHISAAGFEYGHQRDDHVDAALHAQRDAIFRANAKRDQMMRESIGACVELRIRERFVFEDECDCIGCFLNLLLEELMYAQMLGISGSRIVPAFEQCMFFRQHEFERMQWCIGLMECLFEQACEVFPKASDGALIEEIGGIADATRKAVLRVRQIQRDIELGTGF